MTTKSNRPALEVFIVEGEGDKAFWTKVGAAWQHENGEGFTIQLTCLPLDGRLVARKPKPKADKEMGR